MLRTLAVAAAVVLPLGVPAFAAPARTEPGCGTRLDPRSAARAAKLEAAGAYRLPGGVAGGRVVVPVTLHVVRHNDGSGGLSTGELGEALGLLNDAYVDVGLSFCVPGQVVYIDSDYFYSEVDTQSEIDLLRSMFVVPGTINIYFTESLALPGLPLCGISSFTFMDVQGIVVRNSCAGSLTNPSTLAHEVGHYFDLYHTHETGFGIECPDGSNCDTAGDLLCDTPADPKLGADTVTTECLYIGTAANPCEFSGSSAAYHPDTHNYMSYSRSTCRDEFSPQQTEKMLATLQNLRPELVHSECPRVPVVATPGLTRVSVSTSGQDAHGFSGEASVSGTGRFIAFTSSAPDLIPGRSNEWPDIFVRDRQTGVNERISVSSGGVEGDGPSSHPAISDDGQTIAFESRSTNFHPGDASFPEDIYVRDRRSGQTSLVSITAAGTPGNGSSDNPAISADGRFVAFESVATDLVPPDAGARDVFVRDLAQGTTVKVSLPLAGASGPGGGISPAISADGRFVCFRSGSPDLVAGDLNGREDIFVRDLLLGQTTLVSLGSAGQQADWDCEPKSSISADGRYVAFSTGSPGISAEDAPGFISDIFVRDRMAGTTELISKSSAGVPGNSQSVNPAISADGRFVTFESEATNLAPGVTSFQKNIYRRDRLTGQTILLSPGMGETQGDGVSVDAAISANGMVVGYTSTSTNLVPNDGNFQADVFAFDLTPPLVGDLDGDGHVGGLDLAMLLAAWGVCPDPKGVCPTDLNGDGRVTGLDLAMLLGSWG